MDVARAHSFREVCRSMARRATRRRWLLVIGAVGLVVLALVGSGVAMARKSPLGKASCGGAGGSAAPGALRLEGPGQDSGWAQEAGWDLLDGNVILRQDGSPVTFPLPAGKTADGGRGFPGGWVVGVDTGSHMGRAREQPNPRELWLIRECSVPRRIAVAEDFALSRDGRVVVATTDTTIAAYRLPSLEKIREARPDLTIDDHATGLRPIGFDGERVLLHWSGASIAEVGTWNYRTGRFTYSNGPSKHGDNPAEVVNVSMSDNGRVLRQVKRLDAMRNPVKTCIDVVRLGDRLPIEDSGLCDARAASVDAGAISADGQWVVLETAEGASETRRIRVILVRTEDIRAGRLAPIPLTASDGGELTGNLDRVLWDGAHGFALWPYHSHYCRFDGRCLPTRMPDGHSDASIMVRVGR